MSSSGFIVIVIEQNDIILRVLLLVMVDLRLAFKELLLVSIKLWFGVTRIMNVTC